MKTVGTVLVENVVVHNAQSLAGAAINVSVPVFPGTPVIMLSGQGDLFWFLLKQTGGLFYLS